MFRWFNAARKGAGGMDPAWPTIVTKAKTLWRFCFLLLGDFLCVCVSFIRSNKSKIYIQTHTEIDFYCLPYIYDLFVVG